MSPEDRKLRRAARRAQVLAEHGIDAWRPATKVVPSAKRYQRKPRTGSWATAA